MVQGQMRRELSHRKIIKGKVKAHLQNDEGGQLDQVAE
jgi:hypothetical protein